MPKVSPIQTSFNTGEISPYMAGRVDYDKYQNALKTCLNHIPLVEGPATGRPGTRFVLPPKFTAKKTILVTFEFSVEQAYVLEFGDLYVRVYRNNGPVLNLGVHVEFATPYTEADLAGLKFTQSADVLYVAHRRHWPRKITRTSHTAWTIGILPFVDGPYYPAPTTSTTLTPSATSGTVTITASAATDINAGAGFKTTDVGRALRIKHGSTWGWARITVFNSNVSVDAVTGGAFGATTGSVDWRLGLWSDTDGWPVAVAFCEDRLCWGGAPGAPSRIDLSVTSKYEDMTPTLPDGTVLDTSAFAATLNARSVQVIRWLMDDEKGLLAGTMKGEWIVRASDLGEALTPTNRKASQTTNYGSADIAAEKAGKATVFIPRARRKLREMNYVYTDDGFRAPNMTALAAHITKSGLTGLAFAQEPNPLLWAPRTDGVLVGMTYEREQGVLGAHRHVLGGYADAGKTAAPVVESVTVAPSTDLSRDELWLVVKRYVNGAETRSIEYMTKAWEDGDDRTRCVYVDCSLEYDGAPATTLTGLTHLVGETVSVMGDGADMGDFVVAADGSVGPLPKAVSVAQAGLPYNRDGQTLRNNAGAGDGTAQGKKQRQHHMVFRLMDTGAMKVGPSFDKLKELPFRRSADPTDAAAPLYNGDWDMRWDSDYTTEALVCWRFDRPLPGTVVAIMPQQHTQDR